MAKHIINNYRSLATTSLRKHALEIVEAGMEAVKTDAAVRKSVSIKGDSLKIKRKSYDLKRYDRVFVIGIGKAAGEAGTVLEEILSQHLTAGIILDIKKTSFRHLKSIKGTHPYPSLVNMRAAGEIMGILKNARATDLVIAVISGGGSALLSWPHQLKCGALTCVTKKLMEQGANIKEINTVRKHLSAIKGGQFAQHAYPATVASLIFSDVPGDDVDMVASGPTVPDHTTIKDARNILKRYGIRKKCGLSSIPLTETPKESKFFRKVQNALVVSNTEAVAAMKKRARKLGYSPRTVSTTLSGEAREVGRYLARLPKKGQAVIAAGETTVTLKGKGKGGRNQELVLAGLSSLPPETLILSLASDGVDNTPVAGAIGDEKVVQKAKKMKLSPSKFLRSNDSYNFFHPPKSYIRTGPTGINIADLVLVLRGK